MAGQQQEFTNTEEEDLRAYFKDAKYEEYKKYKETGELPASIKFKSDVEVEQKNRKRELTEQYIGINVPEDKQVEAYLALPSVIFSPILATKSTKDCSTVCLFFIVSSFNCSISELI